jgi:hypothetical protein
MSYYPNWPIPPFMEANPFPVTRGRWGDGYGGPSPFDPSPYNPNDFGRSVKPLEPSDFAPQQSVSVGMRYSNKFVEQLVVCSRGLKSAGQRLAKASNEAERKAAAADGLVSTAYLLGVLSTEGISMPIGIFGEQESSGEVSRGAACKEAGDWVDRMIEKYSGGSRGVGGDIGEGVDKIGSCIKETRDNLGL